MHDAMVIVGTALAGGLFLDIQKRLTGRRLILIGMPLLAMGWALLLAMSPSGPFPWPAGAAVGGGMLLTGVLLTLPVLSKALRTRNRPDPDRRT